MQHVWMIFGAWFIGGCTGYLIGKRHGGLVQFWVEFREEIERQPDWRGTIYTDPARASAMSRFDVFEKVQP